MESHTQKSHHIARIDALRGLVVLGMMIAHALFFFHNHSIGSLSAIEQLFNTTVLTGFVFVSGLSLSRWLDIYAHEPTRALVRPALRRAGILYLVYAVTAVVGVVTVVPAPSFTQFIYGTLRALTFLTLPNFTEYLPLFILLVAITLPLRALFRWTRQSLLLTIIAGALSYVIGILLYPLTLAPYVNEIKLLFAGGGSSMRFPLLFYFPVFLLGLWWQHQTDHAGMAKKIGAMQNGLVAGLGIFAAASIIAAGYYAIPLADPWVRWPPSLAFLAIGLSVVALGYLILPRFHWAGTAAKSIIVYFGRDSIDLWMNHLIILFTYRKFIGLQSGNAAVVLGATLAVIAQATAMSSVHLTNRIVFPFHFNIHGSTRLRKRYALIVLVAIVLLLLPPDQSKIGTPTSGNAMTADPMTFMAKLPEDTRLVITTDRKWVTPRVPKYSTVNITLRAVDNQGTPVSVSPEQITFHIGSAARTKEADMHADGSLVFTLPVGDIPAGMYQLKATAPTEGSDTATSNSIPLAVTEPLLVAWTFDWEGWDVPDDIMRAIDGLETPYRKIPFTHFISARTFLPDALPKDRQEILASYLNTRRAQGDEIALHSHMFYDLVTASGVVPRTTRGWGLSTPAGYDIPTTEYNPAEFEKILKFSKNLMTDAGLPDITGYRSGGWFMNGQLLDVLNTHGFTYDSSGRDAPKTGPFSLLPWRLTIGAQPYYPTSGRILEIPNNGVTTYESTLEELTARSKLVYTAGVLALPKTLIYTSHPQFAAREFATIPQMLAYFDNMSFALDRGPVMYVTMSEIHALWTLLK